MYPYGPAQPVRLLRTRETAGHLRPVSILWLRTPAKSTSFRYPDPIREPCGPPPGPVTASPNTASPRTSSAETGPFCGLPFLYKTHRPAKGVLLPSAGLPAQHRQTQGYAPVLAAGSHFSCWARRLSAGYLLHLKYRLPPSISFGSSSCPTHRASIAASL